MVTRNKRRWRWASDKRPNTKAWAMPRGTRSESKLHILFCCAFARGRGVDEKGQGAWTTPPRMQSHSERWCQTTSELRAENSGDVGFNARPHPFPHSHAVAPCSDLSAPSRCRLRMCRRSTPTKKQRAFFKFLLPYFLLYKLQMFSQTFFLVHFIQRWDLCVFFLIHCEMSFLYVPSFIQPRTGTAVAAHCYTFHNRLRKRKILHFPWSGSMRVGETVRVKLLQHVVDVD